MWIWHYKCLAFRTISRAPQARLYRKNWTLSCSLNWFLTVLFKTVLYNVLKVFFYHQNITKKKRPLRGASARRYYRWGSYILVNSIKTWLKSQIVIDNPGGLNHVDFNNTRHASPLDAHLGGFFVSEVTGWDKHKWNQTHFFCVIFGRKFENERLRGCICSRKGRCHWEW